MKTIADKAVHCDFIDGQRGIAILLVLFNHWYHFVLKNPSERWLSSASERWISAGNTGVLLFFFVSAFTLFQSSRNRFTREEKPIRNFYIRRAFRILPLWWLSIALYQLYYGKPLLEHLCCFSMLFGFELRGDHPVVGGWTLFIEETFYLFLPVIFTYLRTFKAAVFFLAITYALRVLWFRLAPHSDLLQAKLYLHFFPFAYWYCFATGILFYFIHRHPLVRRKIFEDPRWGLPLTLAALLLCFRLLGRQDWGTGDDLSAVALAVLMFASFHPHSLFGKLVRARWLRQFGTCCFSLYLLNGLLLLITGPWLRQIALFQRLTTEWPMELVVVATFPIFAWAILQLGKLSFHALEYPLVRLGKRLIEWLERDNRTSKIGLVSDSPVR